MQQLKRNDQIESHKVYLRKRKNKDVKTTQLYIHQNFVFLKITEFVQFKQPYLEKTC